jgi:DNA-binding NarL/FixJ family response regulator
VNEALRAHLRIMEEIPREYVRTHVAKPREERKSGGFWKKRDTLALNARIKALRAEGLSHEAIAKAVGINRKNVQAHLYGQLIILGGKGDKRDRRRRG